jgi:hypothetical protein
LDAQEAENDFAMLFVTFKHIFVYFTNVAFKDVQKADYEFSEPLGYLEHHFRDFVRVAVLMPLVQKMSSRGLSTPSKDALST